MGINGPSLNQTDDRIRRLQPATMREVNSYRVRDMANAAVLILEGTIVPVACGLQRERHHQGGHNDGQGPVNSSAWQVQILCPLKDFS
jgi:hypothetical protein